VKQEGDSLMENEKRRKHMPVGHGQIPPQIMCSGNEEKEANILEGGKKKKEKRRGVSRMHDFTDIFCFIFLIPQE